MRIDCSEPGEGVVLYTGDSRNAPFVGVGMGFDGWQSSRKMPGGWRFFHPYVHTGRLFTDTSGRRYDFKLLIPAKMHDVWVPVRRFLRDRLCV
jgi:hypothetical protein